MSLRNNSNLFYTNNSENILELNCSSYSLGFNEKIENKSLKQSTTTSFCTTNSNGNNHHKTNTFQHRSQLLNDQTNKSQKRSPQSLCVVPKQAPYSRTQKSSSSKAIVSDNMQTKSSSLFQLEKQKSAERLKLLDTLMENERKTLQLYQEKIELTSKLIQN